MVAGLLTEAGGVFEVDGVRFCLDFAKDSTAALFSVKKPADLVNGYPQLIDTYRPERIVEFGIAAGGSTALLYALAHPSKLVAFELDSKPVEGLAEFIDRRGLETRVRPYYGIDQADPRVSAILDDEFGDEPIDLVIDDASHLLAETRATFEMVFPRVRPGGAYVIEDWSAHHLYADAVARESSDQSGRRYPHLDKLRTLLQLDDSERNQPVTRLLIELSLAQASSSAAVKDLFIGRHWIIVGRGSAELPSKNFHVGDLFDDHFDLAPWSTRSVRT